MICGYSKQDHDYSKYCPCVVSLIYFVYVGEKSAVLSSTCSKWQDQEWPKRYLRGLQD